MRGAENKFRGSKTAACAVPPAQGREPPWELHQRGRGAHQSSPGRLRAELGSPLPANRWLPTSAFLRFPSACTLARVQKTSREKCKAREGQGSPLSASPPRSKTSSGLSCSALPWGWPSAALSNQASSEGHRSGPASCPAACRRGQAVPADASSARHRGLRPGEGSEAGVPLLTSSLRAAGSESRSRASPSAASPAARPACPPSSAKLPPATSGLHGALQPALSPEPMPRSRLRRQASQPSASPQPEGGPRACSRRSTPPEAGELSESVSGVPPDHRGRHFPIERRRGLRSGPATGRQGLAGAPPHLASC